MTNTEIIKFETITEREDGTKLVSARELQAKLENKRAFTDWVKPYVKEDNDYLFEESIDFTRFHAGVNPTNGVEIIDYIFTLDMAKEVAMVSKSKKGKDVRRAFIQLEKENKQLKEDLVEVSKIAVSNKEQKQREYETKKTLYSWRNIRTVLMACDYKNLEDTVTDVINFHVNVLKKNDRVYGYSNLDKTSYKQAVRDRVYNILDCVYNNTKDGVLRTVAGEVKETLIKDKIATINRSNGHVISGLQKELESLKPTPLEDMVCINYHAFSYDNSAIDKDGHWKPAYRTWIQNFPMEDIPSINYWLDRGVDFNKPVKIIIKCVNKKEFDTTNLVKAIQDVLFNKERGKYRADDNFIRAGEIETIDFCDDYSDGKMYIDLENIDNCNIIDTNMDANMNEQLHNQEFAEFVSNLFGDF